MKKGAFTQKELKQLLKKQVFIIAEISCNHMQNFDIAVKSIKEAAKSGADAVKFQLFTPDSITIDAKNKHFTISSGTSWDGMTLYDLYKDAYTPREWFPKLQKVAHDAGLFFFASAFDHDAVAYLDSINVPAHKVASFEIQDLPLIEKMARSKKPILMSTGIAEKKDIAAAVDTCRKVGNKHIIVLKCTSEYPTPLVDVNLAVMPRMANDFSVMVGLSDHTKGTLVPSAAIVLGAKVIEKHFILKKNMESFDQDFSLDPKEFSELVESVRKAEKIIGSDSYSLTNKQKKSKALGRSLFVVEDIKKGERFSQKNVRSIRPAAGMHPATIEDIIGKQATQDLVKGTPMKKSYIK